MTTSQIITICVGFVLIVAILWWFFGKHTESVGDAKVDNKIQEANVIVKGGYNPQVTVLKKGIPAVVNFESRDNTACLSHVVFDKLGIDHDFSKDKRVSVKIPTDKAGKIPYHCGMNMFSGKIVVK